MQKLRPNISKTAFWDVNFVEFDFEKNYVFVVDKVFNYGKFNDQLELIRFYGVENIKKMMVQVLIYKLLIINKLNNTLIQNIHSKLNLKNASLEIWRDFSWQARAYALNP